MPHAYPKEHSSILFRGQYVWRTVNGTWAVVIPLLVSIVSLSGVSSSVFSQSTDSLAVLVGGGFSVGAIGFGGLGLYCLRNWIAGRVDRVEVNTDGIVYRQRFTPWSDVRSFYGQQFDNGIMLTYIPNRSMWGDGSLPTTPLLTEQEYCELGRLLPSSSAGPFLMLTCCHNPARSEHSRQALCGPIGLIRAHTPRRSECCFRPVRTREQPVH